MGLINKINEWNIARQQKKITDMKSKGICPDCNGQGIIIFAYEYVTPDQCSGCNGSGSFKDWARTTNYYF